jgi:hypothetical protein
LGYGSSGRVFANQVKGQSPVLAKKKRERERKKNMVKAARKPSKMKSQK